MATTQEILDTLTANKDTLDILAAKMDLVIAKIQGLSQSGGATQQELDQILAIIGDNVLGTTNLNQKIDQALTL